MPQFSANTPRLTRPHRWARLTLVGTATGMALLTPMAAGAGEVTAAQGPMTDLLWLAQAESGEAGEAGHTTATDNDGDYLAAIGLIEGHLTSGLQLYREGAFDLADTHMKHPRDEIYTSLAPEMTERGVRGFEAELAALADTVATRAPIADVEAAYAMLMQATSAATEIGATPRAQFDALTAMARIAANEYAVGVTDGAISDLHEYQDAWGFLQVVRLRAAVLAASSDADVVQAAAAVLGALDETDTAFGDIVPGGEVLGGADILFGAAARIELAALSVH